MTDLTSSAPHIHGAVTYSELVDWEDQPDMVEGQSRTYGKLLYRHADGSSETGIWNCTPGTWHCRVTRDEFCHFLAGACTYTSSSGEVIDVEPGTVAFFPAGWTGVCQVKSTIRKVYMIR